MIAKPLPEDRELLHKMLDETTRYLNAAEPLRDALVKAQRLLQGPAFHGEVDAALRDLEPLLNGRSYWPAAGDIEGRYPAFDEYVEAGGKVKRWKNELVGHLPLTGDYGELPGAPEDVQGWTEDLRTGSEMFAAFVAVVREIHEAILAKLAAPAVEPPAIDFPDLAEKLRRKHPRAKLMPLLVEFMEGKTTAPTAAVAANVHDDEFASTATIRENASRTSAALRALGSGVSFTVAGGFVRLNVDPDA